MSTHRLRFTVSHSGDSLTDLLADIGDHATAAVIRLPTADLIA